MISEFIEDINNQKSFNKVLKSTVKTVQIGSIIIYVFFLLSVFISRESIYITFWITLVAWFSLIMFSANQFLYEKHDLLSYSKKNKNISYDLDLVKYLIKKHGLKNKINDLTNELTNFRKNSNSQTLILVFPAGMFISILFLISWPFKLFYIIILVIFAVFMYGFTKYLDNRINIKDMNYSYLLYCLSIISGKLT